MKHNVPRPLDAICQKAMAHREQDRYQSAAELANEVQKYLAGEPVLAYPEPMHQRAWRWTRRHQRGLTQSLAILVILGLAMFGYETNNRARILTAQQTAREQVQVFQGLVEEARYSIANLNPNDERIPYYDMAKGEEAAAKAIEIFENWGPGLERISVEFDESKRAELKREMYDLVLLRVQARAADLRDTQEAEELLALLDKAGEYGEPSRSYYRLQAELFHVLGDDRQASKAERRLAKDSPTPFTAWDHFLLGESKRVQTFEAVESEQDGAESATQRRLILEDAIENYQAALRDDPDHYWSYYQLGRSYLGLNRSSQAVATLSACIAMKPNSAWAYNTRGLARALSGDFTEALADLNQAKQLHPDFAPADLNLGVVHYLQGDYEKAREYLNSVWDRPRETRLIEAAYYLGEIHRKEGQLNLALEYFHHVTEERPRFRQAWLRLAEVSFLRGDDGDGLKAVDEAIRISHDNFFDLKSAEGCELRGNLLRKVAARIKTREDRYRVLGLARKELETAIGLEATPDRYDELAEILMKTFVDAPPQERRELIAQVIKNCNLGLGIEQHHIDLLDTRAGAYHVVKQQEQSQADYEAVTKIPPQSFRERLLHVQAHLLVGYFKANQDDPIAALNEAAMAELGLQELSSEQRSESHVLLHNQACIYAELSKLDEKQRARLEDSGDSVSPKGNRSRQAVRPTRQRNQIHPKRELFRFAKTATGVPRLAPVACEVPLNHKIRFEASSDSLKNVTP